MNILCEDVGACLSFVEIFCEYIQFGPFLFCSLFLALPTEFAHLRLIRYLCLKQLKISFIENSLLFK